MGLSSYVYVVVIIIVGLILVHEASTKNYLLENQKEISFKKRNIALSIFLGFITLGLYLLYWFASMVKQIKEFHQDNNSAWGEVLLNLFIPFYGFYWFYTRGKQMYNDSVKRGGNISDHSVAYVVLSIFGLTIIPIAMIQREMNHYVEIKKDLPVHDTLLQPNTSFSSRENYREKLQALQDMLADGLITEEDYNKKKEEVLREI